MIVLMLFINILYVHINQVNKHIYLILFSSGKLFFSLSYFPHFL